MVFFDTLVIAPGNRSDSKIAVLCNRPPFRCQAALVWRCQKMPIEVIF